MRSRLGPLIVCLAALAFFLGACSSSTIVSQGNRTSAADADGQNGDQAPVETGDEQSTGAATQDEPSEDDDNDSNDDDSDDDDSDDDEDPPPTAELEEIDGFGLGGSEQIDALVDGCQAGRPTACDVLFHLSDFDTAEEAVALSCGGEGDAADGFCTAGIVSAPGEIYFDDNSEGLDTVVDRCVDDGDMTACDFLFYRSGVGSDVEQIGATCGERVKVAVPDCRTFLTDPE